MPVPTKEKLPERVIAAFYATDANLKMVKAQCEKLLPIITSHSQTITNTFLTCMVDRLQAGVLSIDPLFNHYLNEKRIQFGLGILLRALHLDYIIMLNVLEILQRNKNDEQALKKEVEHFCHIMLSDGAKHTLKLFKENNIPSEMRKRLYNELVNRNPECFHPYPKDGSEPKLLLEKTFSANELVKRLRTSKLPHLAAKDHHYQFYSKYDHFGKLYSMISKQDFEWEFVHLSEAIRELPRSLGIMVSLGTLFTLDERMVEIVDSVTSHCDAIDIEEKKERAESKKAEKKKFK